MRRFFSVLFLLFLCLSLVQAPARAQTPEPANVYDIIAVMNSVRVGFGNPALTIDGYLMASAQNTAEIMASSKSCSHIGGVSSRAMAAGYGGGATAFVTENIACGTGWTAADIVQNAWADDLHMLPATNPSYQHVGAGVSQDEDGLYYYVLHAGYTAGSYISNGTVAPAPTRSGTPPTSVPGGRATETPEPVYAVETAVPQPDGSIIHVVKSGQTLWSISNAYGVSVNDLTEMNNLTSQTIFPGFKLIIRRANTPTVTPTITETPKPPTRTPTLTRTPRPTQPTRTPTLSPTPTLRTILDDLPSLQGSNQRVLGVVLVVVCGLGLAALIAGGLRGKK